MLLLLFSCDVPQLADLSGRTIYGVDFGLLGSNPA